PSKSPVTTLVHNTRRDQAAQGVLLRLVPVDRPTHHCPVPWMRPARSALPSPLKSPMRTSSQLVRAHWPQTVVTNAVPVEWPANHVGLAVAIDIAETDIGPDRAGRPAAPGRGRKGAVGVGQRHLPGARRKGATHQVPAAVAVDVHGGRIDPGGRRPTYERDVHE